MNSARLTGFVVVDRVRTQAPPAQPPPVFPDRVDQRLNPIEVDRAERINGKSQHPLLFFVPPDVRVFPYRDAEDPVWLISIIGHAQL
jgi:hypothetical protein